MYQAQNFDHLIGLEGFSDQSLKNHFQLYEGYVNNTNKALEKLGSLEPGTPEYAEIKRRFGWEFNGMRLHEYHFGAMKQGGTALSPDSPLSAQISKDFGSFDDWAKDFKATAMMRGIGWAILYWDSESKRLVNVWVNEHDVGHLAGGRVILNLDVFEHAFMPDYGLKRADYVDAFLKVIDWDKANERLSAS